MNSLDEIKEYAKGFIPAVGKTAKGFYDDILKSGRFWGGMASSIGLHGLVLLIAIWTATPTKAFEQEGIIEVAYDPTLPPKAQQLVQQEIFVPGGTGYEESAPIDLSRGKISFQSELAVEYSLEKGQVSLGGDVIRINPNQRLSTEEILAQAPIDISRSVGGQGKQNPFDVIAQQRGSAIELDKKGTQIGAGEVEKPSFQGTQRLEEKIGEEVAREGPRTTYSLIGDLSNEDIVNNGFPTYPMWAKQKGLEVSMTISFSAGRDGRVNPAILVTKSTGYPKWDRLIKNYLKENWKFINAEEIRRNAILTVRYELE